MSRDLFRTGCLALAGGLALTPAASASVVGRTHSQTKKAPSAHCPAQEFSQPFLSWRDRRYYALAPGQSADNFAGTGWRLTAGAQVLSATLGDGSTGDVLDLTANSRALSPAFCVTTAYPEVRTMVADLSGHEGVSVSIEFNRGHGWGRPLHMGMEKGSARGHWTVSRALRIHTSNLKRATLARLLFAVSAHGRGAAQDYRLYDVYVDPKMKY